jgi:HK97 family phage major capsid protein
VAWNLPATPSVPIDDYPFIVGQAMPAKTAVSEPSGKYAFFGGLQRSHYFGTIGSIEIAQSQEAAFDTDMTMVRGIVYADCKIVDTGALVVAALHS